MADEGSWDEEGAEGETVSWTLRSRGARKGGDCVSPSWEELGEGGGRSCSGGAGHHRLLQLRLW